MSRSWLMDATHEENERERERTMSCNATNLHMERVVCWPVGTGVRDCPASLAWAHEAWALPGGGLGHWDRFSCRAPALGSVGSGGRWLAGRRWPYGGQVGTLAVTTACTCSRTKLVPGLAPPLCQTSFLTLLLVSSNITYRICINPSALLISSEEEHKHSKKPLFFLPSSFSPPFLFLGLSLHLNPVTFFSFPSDRIWPRCSVDLTKPVTHELFFFPSPYPFICSDFFPQAHNSPVIIIQRLISGSISIHLQPFFRLIIIQ